MGLPGDGSECLFGVQVRVKQGLYGLTQSRRIYQLWDDQNLGVNKKQLERKEMAKQL